MARVIMIEQLEPQDVPYLYLELTKEEATTLLDITGHGIIGSSDSSRRKHTNAIWETLRTHLGTYFSLPQDMRGMITFSDKEKP